MFTLREPENLARALSPPSPNPNQPRNDVRSRVRVYPRQSLRAVPCARFEGPDRVRSYAELVLGQVQKYGIYPICTEQIRPKVRAHPDTVFGPCCVLGLEVLGRLGHTELDFELAPKSGVFVASLPSMWATNLQGQKRYRQSKH